MISRFILKIWGWKIVGTIPNDVPKKLYVVVPHTSNWDFPIGILLKFGYNMGVGFIAKDSLFKFPHGWIFRALGGIAVNRKKTQGFIEAVVETIKKNDRFCTAIAPEGTRKKVKKLKKGFYFIARGAEIPIVYVKFNWGTKELEFEKPHYAADTIDEELENLNSYFAGVKGKIPEWSWAPEINQSTK